MLNSQVRRFSTGYNFTIGYVNYKNNNMASYYSLSEVLAGSKNHKVCWLGEQNFWIVCFGALPIQRLKLIFCSAF